MSSLKDFNLDKLKLIQFESVVPIIKQQSSSDDTARFPDISFKKSLGRKFDYLRLVALRIKLDDIDPETQALLQLDLEELTRSFPYYQRNLLKEILDKELEELTLFDIEIWNENEFFGQINQLKTIRHKVSVFKPLRPKRSERKRGYRDHGHLPDKLEIDGRMIQKLNSLYFQEIEKLKSMDSIRLFPEDLRENPLLQLHLGIGFKILDLERIEAEEIGGSG